MTRDVHERAHRLIADSRVETLSSQDQEWLVEHLLGCNACRQVSADVETVICSLRSVQVTPDPELLLRTRNRVHARARELGAPRTHHGVAPWATAAFCLVWIAWSMPYFWHAFEWAGRQTRCPEVLWKMAFGMWWFIPALALAAVLAAQVHGDAVHEE